ncbi:hypothetical protein CEXT_132301 [Caerostris extrusa]|uniref:Transposase n=1 Tax=Caerostris extrusa TaxID=172846 RepID=A0AAV4R048_CAEEX|nr:hypothetical protein CEXT_132301 [Caerostris extrusa]
MTDELNKWRNYKSRLTTESCFAFSVFHHAHLQNQQNSYETNGKRICIKRIKDLFCETSDEVMLTLRRKRFTTALKTELDSYCLLRVQYTRIKPNIALKTVKMITGIGTNAKNTL